MGRAFGFGLYFAKGEKMRSIRRSEFKNYLKEEVDRTKGRIYPVKASFLRRLLIRKAACASIHPNPCDEFCLPGIGPNYEIIAGYEDDYRNYKKNVPIFSYHRKSVTEPIIVEKALPDGYMILNGHHRWAAALCAGKKQLDVKIVNLTSENDVRRMLDRAASDRRVSLDLDEVVFLSGGEAPAEKALHFPFSRIYKERLRAGIPALFHFLNAQGWDIWVYSSKYYSWDYIRSYFRRYRVNVTGVVTGMGRKAPSGSNTGGSLEKMLDTRYRFSLHIDRNTVLLTDKKTKEFREYPLTGQPDAWAREIMNTVEGIGAHE
jgi:hypothetical protein